MKIVALISIGLFLNCFLCISAHAQSVKLLSSEGYVQTADSVQLFYKIQGEGKDTIVVVHGGPHNSGYFSPDLTPLAAHHTLLYYDQRAAGFSSFLSDTSKLGIDEHVADLETIRKHFHLQKLNLLGHSTGGVIAGFYAAANPEKIKSIILVNSMPAKTEWSVSFTSKLDSVSVLIKKQNSKILYSSPSDTLKACWDYYALDGRGFYPTPQDVRRTWGDVCNSKMSNTLNPAKWHIYASMGNYDLTDKFTEVSAPVLIIAGDDDGIPMASFEQWKNSFQNSTLIKVPGAAHFPHVDAPNVFFTAVELFLQGKTPDSSIFDVSGAGVVLPGDDMGTPYQQARAAIIRVENEVVKFVNKGDWKSAAGIYASDASIMSPGAPPITGRKAIASFWHTAAIRGMKSLELQLMDIELSGELLFGRGKSVIRDDQNEIIDIGKFIAIYKKINNQWVLYTDIWNSSLETRSPMAEPDYLILKQE